MGDETATSGSNAPLVCNGQSSNNAAQELYGTTDNLVYNETTGDGSVTICLKFECSGANVECRDMALEFDFDNTNPPEGNEYSSMTLQLKEGKDLGLPSEIVNYWKNQQALKIGTLKGGESAVYKLTISITEANVDANDDWTMYLDDLGGWQEQDIGSDTGATGDSITFDHTT